MGFMNSETLISFEKVSYFNKHSILEDINLEIRQNEIVTIIGPNGAGKSTICKLLIGILSPTSGTITHKEGVKIGYMPQKLHLNPLIPITVLDFLLLNTRQQNPTDAQVKQVIEDHDLDKILDKQLSYISGGEMQKLLFAKTLLHDADLLVLDEPTRGLDVGGQNDFYEMLAGIYAKTNKSILLISHDLYTVMSSAHFVICLNKHICCSGMPHSIKQHKSYQNLFNQKHGSMISSYTHKHN